MIDRYTLPEMGNLWSPEHRFEKMKEVEVAVAVIQASEGLIPQKAAREIRIRAKVNYKRILQIEKKTKHDVIAFVSQLAESVGPSGRYIHYGLTSSDALDTAQSLLFRDSLEILNKQFANLDKIFLKSIAKYATCLCAGRTHGMHAEPTSFGYKLAGFHAEFRRNVKRIRQSLEEAQICKLSGAVGTYNSFPRSIESKVAKYLGLKTEKMATQVIPRDRHAKIMQDFALFAAGMERLCVELRHLQRTEVGEVLEGFSIGQKGSSAMPHKRNPISAENLTGISRMLRSYSLASLENVVLWHERDMSHSSVERVFLADAFILLHYMNERFLKLLSGLEVREERMSQNMRISRGNLFSSGLLLSLIAKGLSREEAYKIVQNISLSLGESEHLNEAALSDPDIRTLLNETEVQKIFTGEKWRKLLQKNVDIYLQQTKKEKF